MDKKEEYKLLIDTATLAGKLMLENGAEIYRVEDTIRRMLAVSGLKTGESYVTNTGIMVNLDDPSVDSMTVIRRISSRNMDLNMISLVNNISREFCAGNMDLKEAFHELKHLDGRQYSKLMIDLSIVGVAGFFALVFGGGFRDAITAGVDGALIALMLRFSKRLRLNGFIETVLCSVVLAAGAVLMAETFGHISSDKVIISAIMPIVPGAAFTTAIRDILQGDYVAGGAKALEAFVKVAAIVVGVGLGMICTGGVRL